ncbi:AfsR/SARP family transcriptional regulator [Streptomyces sp. TBY4]|uniref:AfsR/SARP family transcriptional regulator n=1 Tax=Streptomyces sp. TBY4 TaxID=2962030 RepID=UPI0020B7D821|nr:AfsR/SARP family transcriptional regulator [Streptomyces sp. TBY4]MCP3760674.1 winged helix-turn-helix domain-containing protein [Streptomyces sp. TBY4]
MLFRVLGPLEVNSTAGEDARAPRAAKIRVVLATLLVRANEVVSADALIDELWGGAPPRTAMTTLQVYVSQLRKLLKDVDPDLGRDVLVTRSPGYLLRLGTGRLDLTVFEDLHERGREAMERADHEAAADLQRQALALWRGPLLSDTPHGTLLHSMAVRLTEVRTAALEQRVRAELQLGRHRELLGELQSLCTELPLHEDFHAHLMVALYRTGRQADALHAFGRLRQTLVDELGIEPGRRLQQLHGRILTGDTALLTPGGAPPQVRVRERVQAAEPVGIPLPDGLFTGREAEIGQAEALLGELPGAGPVVVHGPAGVGKTALALALAHRSAQAFPGGRFLVRMRDADGAPLDTARILADVLQAYGAPEPLPGQPDAVRELLRQRAEGRATLLILDDAASAAQLRPLLAALGALAPRCAVLVTTRRAPAGLGGRLLPLGVLSPGDARQLLAWASGGPARPADPAEERQLTELVALCGHLPAPLRAVGARLAAHPHAVFASLTARMRDETTRLAELRAADEDCYTALHSVYAAAPEPARRAARLLSLLPARPFGVAAAAAVLGERRDAAERTLESVVEAGLLAARPEGADHDAGDGHAWCHDMFRLLAAERLAEEEPQDSVDAAVARLCAVAADEMAAALPRAHVDGVHPLDWFAHRQAEYVALAGRAHRAGLWEQTVRLADVMTVFLEPLAAWDDWHHTHSLALDAAGHAHDGAARTRLLCSLGDLAWQRGRPAPARDLYQRALDTIDTDGPAVGRGRALAGLADLLLDSGRPADAAALVTPTLHESPGDTRGCYEARRVLALAAAEEEQPAAAAGHFEQAVGLAAALGDRRLEAYALRSLDRLRSGAPRPGWTEVRPGVWRTRVPALNPPAGSGRRRVPRSAGQRGGLGAERCSTSGKPW